MEKVRADAVVSNPPRMKIQEFAKISGSDNFPEFSINWRTSTIFFFNCKEIASFFNLNFHFAYSPYELLFCFLSVVPRRLFCNASVTEVMIILVMRCDTPKAFIPTSATLAMEGKHSARRMKGLIACCKNPRTAAKNSSPSLSRWEFT